MDFFVCVFRILQQRLHYIIINGMLWRCFSFCASMSFFQVASLAFAQYFLSFFFVFRANSRNDQQYIDVCVCAMHLRSGHIHMQLIHYASSIATEWLLWRFFVCSFFSFKNKTGGCRSDLFVCFAFFSLQPCCLNSSLNRSISFCPIQTVAGSLCSLCVLCIFILLCIWLKT